MTTTTKQIPDAALDQHIGMFGTTGSGKSYSARHLVERLLRSKAARSSPIVIIDPKGDWWGIRLAADGKTPAYPFIIVGGPHADQGLQIPEENPEAFAESLGAMIVKSSDRLIVDLSELGPEAMRRFVHAFAKVVYHDCRSALTIVMDEADEFAPMSGATGQATHCLSAVARIAKRGRGRGIRLWIISQRPASIHTDVRGQMGAVGCMKLTLPHDIKAVQEWMQSKDPEKAREIAKTFPTLRGGKQARAMGKGAEGWFWSPDHGDPQRVEWPAIETYDSMRTPEHGEERSGIEPTPIDTATLVRALDAAVKDAEANDPKKLREQIQQLEDQLRDSLAEGPGHDMEHERRLIEERDQAREDLADMRRRADELQRQRYVIVQHFERLAGAIRDRAAQFAGDLVGIVQLPADEVDTSEALPETNPSSRETPRVIRETPRPIPDTPRAAGGHRDVAHNAGGKRPPGAAGGDVSGPIAKIASALLWWESIGVATPTREQLGFVAGYVASGGSFKTYMSRARADGVLDYVDGGKVVACRGAAEIGTRPSRPPTVAELHRRVLELLDGPCQKILTVLIEHRGNSVTRTQLGELCGYEASGGSFKTYLSRLSGLKLAKYPNKTTVAASPLLFPRSGR